MELMNGEEKRSFTVKVAYLKNNDHDLFRVSLYDTNINQEQLPKRIEQYINKLNKTQLRDLALNLIYELPEYEFERFVRDNID